MFFPSDSRNVKMVTCLFHLASSKREILYSFIGLRNSILYLFSYRIYSRAYLTSTLIWNYQVQYSERSYGSPFMCLWFITAPTFGVQPECTHYRKIAVIQIPVEILQHLLYEDLWKEQCFICPKPGHKLLEFRFYSDTASVFL